MKPIMKENQEIRFADTVEVVRNGEILKAGLRVEVLNIDRSHPEGRYYYCCFQNTTPELFYCELLKLDQITLINHNISIN